MRARMIGAVGMAAAMLSLSARADDPTKVVVQDVEFQGGAGPIKGYLARPEGDGPFPAILVIHEWYGLNDWIKENARELAGQGYVALAVDLYGGKVAKDSDEAHQLMRALDRNEAVADLKGAAAYLKTQKFVDHDKPFGAIGWCMGGGYAREVAQDSEAVGPTVICYGAVATDPEQIAKLKGKPVLGIFGATDKGIPAAKVKQFAEALEKQGNKVELKIYEGAGHGFMRPGPGHAEAATKDAQERITKFFAANLK